MRKRVLAILLSAVMLLGMVPMSASAATGDASENPAEHWFYDQLSEQGQDIYDAILKMYTAGKMADGVTSFDLIEEGVVERSVVENYLKGNRTLFNDFAAAKDAFDLEHPEAWYVDSSELSFRVTSEQDGTLHAYMGPGKSEDYYVQGVEGADDVREKSAELEQAINNIVSKANGTDYDKVKYVHGQITRSISYRFETDCEPENMGFIRTAYALVTHEGVCEGYARSFQYALNKLGIPCVLIHGLQTSGEPESHMWTAVQLTDENTGVTAWYVVDPTWDDPIVLDAEGNVKKTGVNGTDGGETETYLAVGQNVVGANWQPSGFVSTSATGFVYPEIIQLSYGSGVIEKDGLKVEYDMDMMDGDVSTVYHVSYNGDGLVKAAEKGFYFLVKMYDVNADGSVNEFDDWYYSIHGLYSIQGSGFTIGDEIQFDANKYFGDTPGYLIYNIINCEYVEFAITTKAPPQWKDNMDLVDMGGYYSGDYTDIIAESGLIYNVNGNYEQPPYVKNPLPTFSTPVSVGKTQTIHLEFTDALYRPTEESIQNVVSGKLAEAEDVMKEELGLDYSGLNYSWGVLGKLPHEFAVKNAPKNIVWLCDAHGTHSEFYGINDKCRLTQMEYDITPSKMWADDSVEYIFSISGLCGVQSNKRVNSWSYVFENESAFCALRCPLGIDWNLWGQPQLLDNASDLDLSNLTVSGSNGEMSLDELREQMHLDDWDMNGRIVLSVETIADRSGAEELADAISRDEDVEIDAAAVISSMLYEIDFARVCQKTIVETGDSVRLSVGFPAGVDASALEGLVFKAYHFTRDIEGSCKDPGNPKHEHDGLIYSVEEIPITVTPYGLVITCSSFSPFEIVALDAEEAGIEIDENKYAVITNDGHGSVKLVGAKSGNDVSDDIVAIGVGESRTFTIEPQGGYEVEAVMIGGQEPIKVNGNTFTVSYDNVKDGNALVYVTFVPQTVKEAEKDDGQTVVIPTACTHENKRVETEAKEATCEEDGHTVDAVCDDCDQVVRKSETIPALGHSFVDGVCERCDEVCTHKNVTEIENKAATCTEDGYITSQTCKDCGMVLSESKVIPALGHNFVDGKCTRCDEVEGKEDDPGQGDPGEGEEPEEAENKLPARFTDVKESDWFYKHLAYMYHRGLLKGTGDTTMSPQDQTTRAEVVSVLWRMAGSPAEGKNDFTDVPNGQWYTAAVNWAAKNNLVAGYGGGKFGPDDKITREQMIAIMYRYSAYVEAGLDTEPGFETDFLDVRSVSTWAKKAVIWGQSNELISGFNGYFRPRDNLTRAEMARIMSSFCAKIEKEEENEQEQENGEGSGQEKEQEK